MVTAPRNTLQYLEPVLHLACFLLVKLFLRHVVSLSVVPFQAHCPIYLVNVSSMSAGNVLATAKMQGKACPVLPVLSFLSCPTCPVLPVLFCPVGSEISCGLLPSAGLV